VDDFTKVEAYNLTLVENLSVVNESVGQKSWKCYSTNEEIINAKVKNVLQKNFGLVQIKFIKNVHCN